MSLEDTVQPFHRFGVEAFPLSWSTPIMPLEVRESFHKLPEIIHKKVLTYIDIFEKKRAYSIAQNEG